MTKTEIKKLKIVVEKLTKWESSGKAFGHFNVLVEHATHLKGADRLYEFFCFMKILENLSKNYKIILQPGTKSGKIFPVAPGNKKYWVYFKAEHNTDPTNKYQICYGTKIKLRKAPKTSFAPDISIQKYDSTEDPDETMVELIMDAKFKFKNTDTLPIIQLNDFIQRVTALETINADSISLQFSSLLGLKGNCLLTNGNALNGHETYCKIYKIKQVEKFDTESCYNVVG